MKQAASCVNNGGFASYIPVPYPKKVSPPRASQPMSGLYHPPSKPINYITPITNDTKVACWSVLLGNICYRAITE